MKEIQHNVKTFCQEYDIEIPLEYSVLDLMSELGEIAKEILKSSNYGKKPVKHKEELKGELGDVFYSLITIANTVNVDLEDALQQSLEKYKRRLKKGSPGSEQD